MLSSIMDNMNAVVRAALIERLENDKKFGDYWALIFHHKATTWNSSFFFDTYQICEVKQKIIDHLIIFK